MLESEDWNPADLVKCKVMKISERRVMCRCRRLSYSVSGEFERVEKVVRKETTHMVKSTSLLV
jgi:hypothetical protein